MRSTITAYPEGSPCTSLSIFTGSAVMPSTLRAATRSASAQGKVSSWPKRMPTFFISFPPISCPFSDSAKHYHRGDWQGR